MEHRQLFLRDILAVLFKRKLLIVSFAVLVVAVVFVGNYAWPPTYESTAKVRIMRGREVSTTDPTVLRSSSGVAMIQMTVEDVNSEIDLIYSNEVLEGVVDEMDLRPQSIEGGSPLRTAFGLVKSLARNVEYALALKNRPDPQRAAVEALRKAITVTPVKNSHVLKITCELGDPGLAQQVLNNIVQAYIRKHLEIFSSPQSSPFFEKQLERVQGLLAKAQGELDRFRNEHKILSVEVEKQLVVEQYTEAKKLLAQLSETESATAAVGEATSDEEITAMLANTTDNTVVTEMQLRLLELLLERNRIRQTLGPRHPEVLALAKEIGVAQSRMRDAIAANRAMAEKRIQQFEDRLKALNDLQAQLDRLKREVTVHANSFDYYSEKLEESRVADELAKDKISNIKIVSSPTLPIDPIRPRKMLNLALAVIGGIVGALGLAFFLEYLDHGLKTPEDVDHYLGVPTLASFFRSRGPKLNPKEAQRLSAMIDIQRTDKPIQMVQVQSSISGEGSGRVARALADAKAEDPNAKTLLVDLAGEDGAGKGEVRKGFLDALLGEATLDETFAREGNLYTLTRGDHKECPDYLWSSEAMQSLLAELRQRFDRVIVHTAPALQSSEAIHLAAATDGAVLVVRADDTRREVAARAIEMLGGANARILGVVLTERKQQIPSMVYRRI